MLHHNYKLKIKLFLVSNSLFLFGKTSDVQIDNNNLPFCSPILVILINFDSIKLPGLFDCPAQFVHAEYGPTIGPIKPFSFEVHK